METVHLAYPAVAALVDSMLVNKGLDLGFLFEGQTSETLAEDVTALIDMLDQLIEFGIVEFDLDGNVVDAWSESHENTTNNREEMLAILKIMKELFAAISKRCIADETFFRNTTIKLFFFLNAHKHKTYFEFHLVRISVLCGFK